MSEIKLGGTNTTPSEYVTLFNAGDHDVSLANWSLEYAKPAFDKQFCASIGWKAAASSSVNVANVTSMVIPAHSASAPIAVAMNDAASGALHLLDDTKNLQDLVGWGSATSAAPCFQTAQAAIPANSSSLQRYRDCSEVSPVDTANNAADFAVSSTPQPGQFSSTLAPSCQITPTPPTTTLTCEGVVINELLPNPAGTDSAHEYIELYNPTDEVIPLNTCSLQVASTASAVDAKSFTLPAISLQPNEFHTFYDTESNLTLPNSSGGTAWLVTAANVELQTVTYPANLDDDVAWMLGDATWAATYTPTPNGANVLTATLPCPEGQVRNTETNRCNNIETATAADAVLAPCAANQTRNPETNRCRNNTTDGSAGCPAGQTRNPETNRCRANTTAAAATTACKAGQERNPETNRCRNIAAAATTSKPCPTGQERNKDTNRCRKIVGGAGSNTLNNVKDVNAGSSAANSYWILAAIALAGAIAYGIYEWRQEIMEFARKRLKKPALALQPLR